MYNLTADQIRVSNIENIRVNGVASTLFDVYRKHYDKFNQESWVFAGREQLKGTIKRESTIIRKITQ